MNEVDALPPYLPFVHFFIVSGFYLFLFIASFYEEGEEVKVVEENDSINPVGPAYTEIKEGFVISNIDADGAAWENLKYNDSNNNKPL